MSLGWTAKSRGFVLPKAVIVFYSPSDYEDECTYRPIGGGLVADETYILQFGLLQAPQGRKMKRRR
jgi:hypothetical protein